MDPMNSNSDAGIPGAIVSPNEPAMPVGGGVGASRAADSGDIVLAPSGKTSGGGRKGLVAFLMVLALAAIVGVTLWMVWPKGDDTDSESQMSVEERIAYNLRNMTEVQNNLIESYNDGGIDKVLEYYNKNIACPSDYSGALVMVCTYEENYYDEFIAEYIVFSEAGCVINGETYDYDCAEKYYGEEGLSTQLLVARNMNEYLAILESDEMREAVNMVVPGEESIETGEGDE